jgi:uncharacterized protein (DUF1501 family)
MRSQAFLSRREMLTLSAAGVSLGAQSGWFRALADQTAAHPQRRRACILLWMNGGPSQMDTFDLKPGHENGGTIRPIQTAVPGLHISEHLPRLARQANDLAIIRSMSTREGDHGRGSYLMHTGYLPIGALQYPTLGSLLAKELGSDEAPLPNFISIAPFRFFNTAAHAPGFLGPRYAPLLVGENANFQVNAQADGTDGYRQRLRVDDLQPPEQVQGRQFDSRVELWQANEADFAARYASSPVRGHQAAYDRAVRLMRSTARAAFDLDQEPGALRDAYGRNMFGQGCLLARRLVERGVPFVEVTLGPSPGVPIGWDTHQRNFETVAGLCQILDPAWATLIADLRMRGLFDDTLIVWMGEFGRTPKINAQGGRDHFPAAWTTVLAGGGIRGGQAFGATSADGMEVAGRAVSVADLFATVCRGLGVDPTRQNMSNVGRPIPLVDRAGTALQELLA